MICPRCGVGRLENGAATCTICGFQAPRSDDVVLSVTRELEQQARRELDREFEIIRLVGRGGMSVVYLAQERELGREIALKLLPLHLAMGEDAPDRFKREAKIAASLDHPHIVPVHRVGATPRFLWYTMKYVRGRSLADIVTGDTRLGLDETVRIVAEVASGLHYAHKRGVVHRDVKPGNVMLDETGWAWVCDFGVAKAFGTLPLTQTGGALGTPAYMSPEQCYGKPLDGRADQYALAVLTFECLAGRPPFVADSMGEYVRLHCTQAPPRIEEFRDDLPQDVRDTVARALAKEPEDRFPTVLDFAAALGADLQRPHAIPTGEHAIVGGQPITPNTPHPHVAPANATRSRIPARRLGAYVAGGLAVGVLLTVLPNGTRMALPDRGPEPETGAMTRAAGTDPVRVDSAQLFVATYPIGQLYINGRLIGQSRTPRTDPILLAPGTYTIRVEAAGYEPYEDEIDVLPGQVVEKTGITLTAR